MTSTRRRHARRAASIALPILLGAGPGGAAEPAPEAEALRAGVELIESRRLYAARCAGCHGLDGAGTD